MQCIVFFPFAREEAVLLTRVGKGGGVSERRWGDVVVSRRNKHQRVPDVQAVVEGHLQPQGQQGDEHQHLHVWQRRGPSPSREGKQER